MKNEKDSKSYLGSVVTSLHTCHPGASYMVFNFAEGDQISLLSDILINYDMTVIDYPRHYEGYPLLPLEMIHYFLRSSESWLSLEGQKNVILMHCEPGGWPVLSFMLAGLLLYRKQYSGEQKTLERVNKQAPKDLSSNLSPLNPRASQLRYLHYITGRELASEWPPSDAPVIIEYILLRNLPLFDAAKGCRPVVRVYGQDLSAKANRSARLYYSSLMADESAWKYSKEECVFVKLALQCQIQGDVFLECIHLQDDLVTEEIIFKVMFHTGFTQANVLALDSNDVDVPWNTKLPKDFKAEVLFRDMNEVPVNITLELGGEEEFHDSESEFFEVEEILTPMPDSGEKAEVDSIIGPEIKLLDNIIKDCTLRNGSPRWDLDVEEIDVSSSFNQIAPAKVIDRQVSEAESDTMSTSSKNVIVVDSCGSEIQDVKVEIEPKPVVLPSPTKPKPNKKNKWQEITAKTINQQRVISQWVPRAKTPPVPEANKPKAPVYKWVPKEPAMTPTETTGEE
ncbi:hypothetical protein BVRB_2g042340 [Beta vulgaris subsp. vulgaris]|nr:hypothetical protein BVRB_2g042340 [Beta vulgaris subsp. vulgaris]